MEGRVWLLDSGTGRLVEVEPGSGRVETVVELPGYTRGLAIAGSMAFVGLSKIRETSTFGGVKVAERQGGAQVRGGDGGPAGGRQVGLLEFHSGIEEIFDVQLVPGVRRAMLSGPHPELDDQTPIWLAPAPA